MNMSRNKHKHPNNATDRTPAASAPAAGAPVAGATAASAPARRLKLKTLGIAVAVLLVYTCVPSVSASAAEVLTDNTPPAEERSVITESSVLAEGSLVTESSSAPDGLLSRSRSAEEPSAADPTEAHTEIPTMPRLLPSPLARAVTTIRYPYPSGAMAVTLYKDGKTVLQGHVADIGGVVYVPVQRFADLFGQFRTSYVEATEEVVITGQSLSITVRTGDPYITVNDRIFYTGAPVLSLGGWIFVPMTAMCKAGGAQVTIRAGYYDAFITSGDPTALPWASEYYNSTDLYWLSRIISAEAKGEPLTGQIAVGNVVLNRKRSSQFPNTVKEVIFDTKYGTQFSPAANGTVYQTPTASSVRAAKICLEGYSLSGNMLYFYNPRLSTSTWIAQNRPFIISIGNHRFYG